MKKTVLATVAATTLLASSAYAHFQMVYTPNTALTKGQTVDFKHVFTHPFSDEHTMDMVGVEEFYVIHKEQKTDLKADLKPIILREMKIAVKDMRVVIKQEKWAIMFLL